MDKVNAGIGLQEVAPSALARMRLAGHQQHAQIFAYRVHRGDRAVVALAGLIWQHIGRQFDYVCSRAAERHFERGLCANLRGLLRHLFAIDKNADSRLGACRSWAVIGDKKLHLRWFACEAEAGRLGEADRPVELLVAARDQRVHRRVKAKRGNILWHIVHLAVCDQNGASNAVWRHVAENVGKRGKQPG